jgi:6-phosphofructokinase 1
MVKRIGILTGGGDCPGLNAVIRAIVRKAIAQHQLECFGILRGWRGLLDGLATPLTMDSVSGILPRGGTILRTSRTNPFLSPEGPGVILAHAKRFALDAVVAIGGVDTFVVGERLHREHGLPVVGVPATIDNDVGGTEYTFGFDSTVNIAMEAIDRIHTTAESHDRVMIVEVMGRMAGWIALYAGVAGGADIILIPEHPIALQEVCDAIVRRHDRGKDFSIVVIAEGVRIAEREKATPVLQSVPNDEFGLPRVGGIGQTLAREIEKRTGYDTRVTVLGHIQRGGTPTGFDRVLGSRFGIAAVDLVLAGKFGHSVALQANEIVAVPLADATRRRTVPPELYDMAKSFFG